MCKLVNHNVQLDGLGGNMLYSFVYLMEGGEQ